MFILIFFLVVAISQFVVNKMLCISEENEDSYAYNKKDSLVLAILFLVGIILQILSPRIEILKTVYWWLCGIYAVAALIIMVIFMTLKKNRIEKIHEEIKQVYEILQKMVDRKNEGLDFNNVPFTLSYKYGNINKIDVVVEPTSFDEKILSVILQQLNNFLPTFTWTYELHLEERYMTFVGNDKPPTMARWPGSWLRPLHAFPMGISGNGELIWQPDSANKKKLGRSLYLDEKGNPINIDMSLSKAPQGLVAGGPLGLDTIIPTTTGYKTMKTIEVGDFVFGYKNKPIEVVEVLEINQNPIEMFELVFKYIDKTITIKSDAIHRFPVVDDLLTLSFHEEHCKNLFVSQYVLGNNCILRLIKKIKINSEPVRCIKVNSDKHIFLVTDKKNKNWSGGQSYPYFSIYTFNTGGGKAIWIDQEIE